MSSQKHWSQYWQQGNKTSFGGTLDNGYDGVLKIEWDKVFCQLKSDDAVLDLCTGNLSLIRMAEQSINVFSKISFIGVDYANIVSDSFIEMHSNVELMTGINIENTPCNSGSFDQVISNFGIEYSDMGRSIAEVSRLLKVNGKVDLVCHHQKSSLINTSSQEFLFVTDLLKEEGALNKLECLLVALAIPNNDNKKEKCRSELNVSMSLLLDKYKDFLYSSEFMKFFRYILSQEVKDKVSEFNAYKQEQLGYKCRVESMVNAALTEASLLKVNQFFSDNKLKITEQYIIKNNDEIIAYKISAKKLS